MIAFLECSVTKNRPGADPTTLALSKVPERGQPVIMRGRWDIFEWTLTPGEDKTAQGIVPAPIIGNVG